MNDIKTKKDLEELKKEVDNSAEGFSEDEIDKILEEQSNLPKEFIDAAEEVMDEWENEDWPDKDGVETWDEMQERTKNQLGRYCFTYNLWESLKDHEVILITLKNGKKLALSNINVGGGVCDDCHCDDYEEDVESHKIIDLLKI